MAYGWLRKAGLALVAALALGYGVYRGVHFLDQRNDGFTIEKIYGTIPNDKRWEIPHSVEETTKVNAILDQPFHYLARGFQCYVFESADHKHVLKFLRHQRLRPPLVLDFLPKVGPIQRWYARKMKQSQKRQEYLLRSLKFSKECAADETAILFVHINKTKEELPVITISDKCGTRYEVPLDNVEFLLQRKALGLKPTIEMLMAAGKVEEAKRRIDQVFLHLAACAKKGIFDADGALIRKNNLGFLDDRAIYIDGGKLTHRSSLAKKVYFKKDLHRLEPLYKWLQERFPQLAVYFRQKQRETVGRFSS